MESFGRYLRSEREQRGISIEEISRATKISPGQLKALESDDLSALPPLTYVKGFVRAYAKHIGIDPNDVITRFENYLAEIGQEDSMSHDFVSNGFRRTPPNYSIAVAAGGIILLLIVILMILVRACGGSEEAFRKSPPLSSQTMSFSSAPLSAEVPSEALLHESEPQTIVPLLPSVPPDAFRVSNTGSPKMLLPVASSPRIPEKQSESAAGD